jgi:hypothetical protein
MLIEQFKYFTNLGILIKYLQLLFLSNDEIMPLSG